MRYVFPWSEEGKEETTLVPSVAKTNEVEGERHLHESIEVGDVILGRLEENMLCSFEKRFDLDG